MRKSWFLKKMKTMYTWRIFLWTADCERLSVLDIFHSSFNISAFVFSFLFSKCKLIFLNKSVPWHLLNIDITTPSETWDLEWLIDFFFFCFSQSLNVHPTIYVLSTAPQRKNEKQSWWNPYFRHCQPENLILNWIKNFTFEWEKILICRS